MPGIRRYSFGVVLLLAACTADPVRPTDPVDRPGASTSIGQAVSGFYWLPPMVPNPGPFTGAFDPNRTPTVTLACGAPAHGGCDGVFEYPFGSGPSHVRLDTEGESYSVVWRTPITTATGDSPYLLTVREGEATLAEAEVWLVKSRSEANALKGQKLAAVPGLPYLIKFRIEEGQSPPPPTLRVTIDPTAATLVPGESFTLTAAVVTSDGQTVPDAVITWSSSASQTALVSPAGIVQAVAVGSVDITAASPGAVSASAAITVGALPLPRSATIGTSGGSLSTPLADGGTLDLVVPAGAVGGATAFTLEPLQREAGALNSFRFTPASRIFNLPIRFTYTPPTGVGTANLYLGWQGDLGRRAIALEPDGPSLRVTGTARIIGDLPELPPIPAVSTPSARAADLVAEGDGSIDISMLAISPAEIVAEGRLALDRYISDPSFDHADDLVFVMDLVGINQGLPGFDPEGTVLLSDWRAVVCNNFDAALQRYRGLSVVPPFGFEDWEREVRALAAAAGPAEQTRAMELHLPFDGCPNGFPDYAALLGDKVADMEPYFAGIVFPAGRDFVLRFHEIIDAHLVRVLGFKAQLEILGLLQFHPSISRLEALTMTELRKVAWQRCRDVGELSRLGRLVEFEASLREAQSAYTLADIAADLIGCTTSLEWRVRDRDANGEGPGLSQGALGGTAMGTATSSASISMTENGELVLKGLIHILQCPTDIRTGTTSVENEEQLVIKVVGANGEGTVATRSPQLGGPRAYLHNDSIVVNVDQINTALGGEDDDFIQLKVNRVGNTCDAPLALLPGEVTLARFDVSIPRATVEVSPTTATLEPGATATFTATTEHTTSDLTWEVTGGTQVVQGNTLTYTAGNVPGSYQVKVKLADHPDREAVAAVTIEGTCPAAGPALSPSRVAAGCVGITLSPTSTTLNFNQTRQFTAWVEGASTTAVTWSTTGGTISQTGVFTATSVGTHTVRATSVEDPTVFATATVSVFTSGGIIISPSNGGTGPGRTRQYSVVVGTGPFSWSADGGTISQTGLFTAGEVEGEYAIRASSATGTGVAAVTVDWFVGIWDGTFTRQTPSVVAFPVTSYGIVRQFLTDFGCGVNQNACYATSEIDLGAINFGSCFFTRAALSAPEVAGYCGETTTSTGGTIRATVKDDAFTATVENIFQGQVIERWSIALQRRR